MPRLTLTAAQAVQRAQQMDLSVMAPLRPVLIGPVASLRRYTVAAERTAGAAYDPVGGNVIAWPDLGTDETVDQDYAKVYLETARLRYFTKAIGVNGSCQPSTTYPNRVRAANFAFKTANGTARSSDFYDRDVRVGDVASIRAVVASVEYTHTSTVTGFVGEAVAAVVGTATADPGNRASQGASGPTITQVSGTPVTDVVAAAGGSYNSLADGYITRTYTITVIQASTGGNATTARLRIDSGDGLDDQDNVVPSAFGVATAIGTKGATATFSIDPPHSSSSSYGLSEADFAVGQQWTLTVAQAFTQPGVTAGGTYTGPVDDTILVRVSIGGALASSTCRVTMTTAKGLDSSGPTVATGAPVSVGSYGVTITFSGTNLRAGDVYRIPVTAATEGAVRTLTLAENVPAVLQGVEVELKLYIPQTGVELARTRQLPTPAVNWTTDAGQVTVLSGIYLTDSTLTNGGAPVAVPLASATLFVHYRAWRPVSPSALTARAATLTEAAAAAGASDPDNPLGWAASRALAGTAGQLLVNPSGLAASNTDPVLLVPTGDPSVTANWTSALAAVEDVQDAYHLVPLTTDEDAIAAVKAHVDAQSTDDLGFHRVMWVAGIIDEELPLVDATTTSNGSAALATIAAYPAVTPTEYTLLTVTSSNADFLTAGVRAGDEVRYNFQTDSLGVVTYDSYDVREVLSSASLRLLSGPGSAAGTPVRVEIWRAPTRDELVTQLTEQADAYATNPSRVRVVWCDTASFGGSTVDTPTVCAALAGLAGSVPSQQGLRNVGVPGVDAVATGFFTARQLDALTAGGVFVVDSDASGNVYIRSAVTADTSAVTLREEMCVRNGDAVRFQVQDAATPFLGIANVTDMVFRLLQSAIASKEAKLKSANQVPMLGPPVAQLELTSLAVVEGAPDQINATVAVTGAVPFNRMPVTVNLS